MREQTEKNELLEWKAKETEREREREKNEWNEKMNAARIEAEKAAGQAQV